MRPDGTSAPRPARSVPDLVISIALLVMTVVLIAMTALAGLFLLAFLDHCPPPTCSVQGAVNAVMTALLAAAAVGFLGGGATVIALVRRSAAWPYALGTLALCALTVFLGGVGFSAATA